MADIAFELPEAQINYMFKLFLDTWTSQDSQTKDREILLSLVYKLGMLRNKIINFNHKFYYKVTFCEAKIKPRAHLQIK